MFKSQQNPSMPSFLDKPEHPREQFPASPQIRMPATLPTSVLLRYWYSRVQLVHLFM